MVILLSISSYSQEVNHQNHTHYGPENPDYCANNIVRDRVFEEHPELAVQDSIDRANFEIEYRQYLQEYDPNARSTYVIPVVVHICHLGGVDNISDEQVYDAIEKLNADFSATNSDVGNTVSPFDAIVSDADIEFRLATKDPNGICHPGITRTYTENTVHDGDNDLVADVYNEHGNWPQNRYMNVFVCQDPAGAAGYTNNPANWYSATGMGGSIYMRHDYMGTIGTGSNTARHTLSHEVGHWLNLSHCWGSNNNPGQSGACSEDDYVDDTPRTIGWTICDIDGNTCSNDDTDGYWTSDVIDNVQNIMEYSYCSTMFTQGQAARMHTALNSSTAQRNNLWTASNLAATGTDGPGDLCEAKFSSNTRAICVGQSVEFTDESYHNVVGRSWSFNGGSPATSTAIDPVVTYNTPGVYAVTLDVTDGTANQSTTVNEYIVVLSDPGEIVPYSEGFEDLSAVPDNLNWMIFDESENGSWELTTALGASGSPSCAVLANYGVNDGSIDELISAPIDLSNVDGSDPIIFNFEYAYRKVDASDDEWLQFYISKDCGETWVLRKNLHGDGLSEVTASTSYVPVGSGDWYSVDVTNIGSDYYVSNFRFKFVFENDGGNNLYIDNINLYPASMTGIIEQDKVKSLTVYPNPTNGTTYLKLNAKSDQEYAIRLLSALGQEVSTIHQGNLAEGVNKIELSTDHLAKGIYIIEVKSEGQLQTVKLIKK